MLAGGVPAAEKSSASAPAFTDVVPVWALPPVRVWVPAPILVSATVPPVPPLSRICPANVAEAPPAPTVRVEALPVALLTTWPEKPGPASPESPLMMMLSRPFRSRVLADVPPPARVTVLLP